MTKLQADTALLAPLRIRSGLKNNVEYDLNIAVLTHCQNRNLWRISSMKECGLFNTRSLRVHVTIIGSPGDFDYVDEICNDWKVCADVSMVEMASNRPVPKINGYYLWLMSSGLRARWHARVDDDSITDLFGAVNDLDRRYGDIPVHAATPPVSWFDRNLFIDFLDRNGISLANKFTEYESSFTSGKAMNLIFSDPRARAMIVETGCNNEELSAPGDRALAVGALIADIPVTINPLSTSRYQPNDLTAFGGNLYHIHYVPWDREDHLRLIRAFVLDATLPFQRFIDLKFELLFSCFHFFHLGLENSAVLSFSPEGDVIGATRFEITRWRIGGSALVLMNSAGETCSVLSSFLETPKEIVLRGFSIRNDRPAILRVLLDRKRHTSLSEYGREESDARLRERMYHYCRLGFDSRDVYLASGGLITVGSGGCERRWRYLSEDGSEVIEFYGDHELTCKFRASPDGVWRGAWEIGERMQTALFEVYPC